jgi:pimeloyl-ACP methyl ester carboxylesterase
MTEIGINRAGTVRKLIASCLAFGTVVGALAAQASAQNGEPQSGYAPIHGLHLYYEIHGSGDPLLLLHGGLGAGQMFSPILPELSKTHRVITVDLQGHGHTADIDRPLSLDAMAEDLAGLLNYLKIAKADVMGYSMGGAVGLRLAVQHPEFVNRLVLVSTVFSRDGWYPEVQAAMSQIGPALAEPMKQTPIYQLYASTAPRPEDWSVLLTKMGELLRKQYDWSKDVATLRVPTLLVFGDADAVRTAHAVHFFELLGGGMKDGGWDGSGVSTARLAILPGLTHYNIFSSPALVSTVMPFLDGRIQQLSKSAENHKR